MFIICPWYISYKTNIFSIYRSKVIFPLIISRWTNGPAPPWIGWIICSTTSRSGRGAASRDGFGSSAGADLPELVDFLGSNWKNGCTFPCYFSYILEEKHVLCWILEPTFAICTVHRFFHGVRWFTQSVHRFFHSFHWVCHGFNWFLHGFNQFFHA